VRVGDSRRGDDAVPHRPSAGIIKYRVNLPESASKVRRLSSSILNAISKISRAHPLFGWPRTRESSPHSDRRGASFFNPPAFGRTGGCCISELNPPYQSLDDPDFEYVIQRAAPVNHFDSGSFFPAWNVLDREVLAQGFKLTSTHVMHPRQILFQDTIVIVFANQAWVIIRA